MSRLTLKEACREWVNGFNAIPQSLLCKLDCGEMQEITPPSAGDSVYILYGKHRGEYGEISNRCKTNEDKYKIILDGSRTMIYLTADDFEVQHSDSLPMWGTMWTFGDLIDEEWATGVYTNSHLQDMADCGFRLYEQEDLGLVFGIDGAGYDFYESHWIPLYKARGLHWHDEARAC